MIPSMGTESVTVEVDAAVLVSARAVAQLQRLSLSQVFAEAIRFSIATQADAAANCPRCRLERERQVVRRRTAGQPVRQSATPLIAVEPRDLSQRECPICDAGFTPHGYGHQQKYCSRRCMKYAGRHGVEQGRLRYQYFKQTGRVAR